MRIWLDGHVIPVDEARVSVLDRGFLFGDGVYELVRCFDGVGVGLAQHVARLESSLRRTGIRGCTPDLLPRVARTLLDETGWSNSCVYLQVTRGTGADRQHVPAGDLEPTVLGMITPAGAVDELDQPTAVACRTARDPRWRHCSIKTTSLMGNIMSILGAAERGAEEAILLRDGFVGEGSHTNVFAVVDGVLVTPPTDAGLPILHGVTRTLLLDAAVAADVRTEVRPLPVRQLDAASEVMITSSRRILHAVTMLDGRPVGPTDAAGRPQPGPVTSRLLAACRARIDRDVAASLNSPIGSTSA